MASNVTLGQLRTLTRLYADERTSATNGFVTNTELDTLLNLELRSLYDRLIAARGHDYYESEATVTLVVDQAKYTFASMSATDFYQLRRLQLEWGTRDVEPVDDFKKNEELWYQNIGTWGEWGSKGYRIVGNGIVLKPVPKSAVTMRMLYIPRFTDLAETSSVFDGVNGWHDAVALCTAAKILDLQQQDSSALVQRRDEVLRRIDELAESRTADEPSRVVDVAPEDNSYRRHGRLYGLPRPS